MPFFGGFFMNMDQLRYLLEISKSHTMAEAAEKLYLTPQALSMAIKKLEKEIDMVLLYRFSNGVILSEEGEWLVDLADEFFKKLGTRIVEYSDLSVEEQIVPRGKVELAVNITGVPMTKFTNMICDIYNEFPDFDISVHEETKDEIENKILKENIDLGFMYRAKLRGKYIDNMDDSLLFYPLQRGALVLQVSPDLPLAKYNSLSLNKISRYDFCGHRSDVMLHRFEKILENLCNREVHYEIVSSFPQYCINITSGKYLGFSLQMLGESKCATHIDGMKIIPIEDDISVYFGIVRKNGRVLSNNMAFIYEKTKNFYKIDREE